VVSDGGSTDDTVAIAARRGVRVVHSATGRGRQLNRGAQAATGRILWFIHADAQPPASGAELICEALARRDVVGGAFWRRTLSEPGHRYTLGRALFVADARSYMTRYPYGDQGIFVTRDAFEAVGGYPDYPILEDVALVRALWNIGRLKIVHAHIEVSGRRLEANPWFYTAVMGVFPVLFRLGVSPHTLARWYPHERTASRPGSPRPREPERPSSPSP
jgi:glycosyltransferase involved in cell wall biosynthesis